MSDYFSVIQDVTEVVTWQKLWGRDEGNSTTDFHSAKNGHSSPHLLISTWGEDRIKLMPTVDPKAQFKERTVNRYGYETVLIDDVSLTLDQARKLVDNLEAAITFSVLQQRRKDDDNVVELFPADDAE